MAFDAARSARLGGIKLELSLVDRSGKVQNFYAAEPDIVQAMQQAMHECAQETARIAFELCPVDTGFMREHIRTEESTQTFETGWFATDFFDANLPFYPPFVVLGTRFQAPNDPLTPAHEQVKPLYEERMRELVGQALERRAVRAGKAR